MTRFMYIAGYTAVTVDAGRHIIALSSETHHRVALYQLRGDNEAVQCHMCHMLADVEVYGGDIEDALPEVMHVWRGNAAVDRGTVAPGWEIEDVEFAAGVVSICFPYGRAFP